MKQKYIIFAALQFLLYPASVLNKILERISIYDCFLPDEFLLLDSHLLTSAEDMEYNAMGLRISEHSLEIYVGYFPSTYWSDLLNVKPFPWDLSDISSRRFAVIREGFELVGDIGSLHWETEG